MRRTDPNHATAIHENKSDDVIEKNLNFGDIDGTGNVAGTRDGDVGGDEAGSEEGEGAKAGRRAEQMKFQVGWLVLPRTHAARCPKRDRGKAQKPHENPRKTQ